MNKSFPPDSAESQPFAGNAAPQAQLPRLFFDVSSVRDYVREYDCYSGIQRVVAMVLTELAAQIAPERVFITFVSHKDGQHYCVRLDTFGADSFLDPLMLRRAFDPPEVNARAEATNTGPAHNKRDSQLQARPIRHWPMILLSRMCQVGAKLLGKGHPETPVQDPGTQSAERLISEIAHPCDKLVLLDSTWNPSFYKAYCAAHSKGMRVFTLVHDLIPLIHSATTDGDTPRVVHDWLRDSIRYTDTYLVASETTRRDLEDFLVAHAGTVQIRTVPLARAKLQIPKTRPEHGEIVVPSSYAPALAVAQLQPRIRSVIYVPYVLCVGTIEPRKNIWRLLLAWKSLIDQGRSDIPRLVLAGRIGWMS